MQVKILGCGNSVGVPVIGCDCDICISCDLKDKRTRSSAFLKTSKSKVLIDASPDIRLQSIKHGISELDAVFLTHIHFDHVCGVHDLPAFCATKNFDDEIQDLQCKKAQQQVYRWTLNIFLLQCFSKILHRQ